MGLSPSSSHGGAAFDGSNKWAQYGFGATIPDTTLTAFNWTGGLISGTEQLAYAVATAPTVLASGIYSFAADIFIPTGVGAVTFQCDLDASGNDFRVTDKRVLNATTTQEVTLTCPSVYIPLGGAIVLAMSQVSGSPVEYDPNVTIQRIA